MTLSAILPAYNCEDCLERALQSVLDQGVRGLELVVIDDGSTDGTPRIIRRYRKHLRAVRQNNRGVSAARNRGIRMARKPLIAFIDSDDVWLPGKLKHQIDLFRRYPDVALTTTGSRFYSKGGKLTRIEKREFHGRLISQLAKGDFINTSTVVVKKEALRPFPEPFPEGVHYAEDYVLWVRLALRHDFHASPEILVDTRSNSHGDFLRKYSEADVKGAYGLILKEVEGHYGEREVRRFRSRLYFELASIQARKKNLGKMLCETWAGLEANAWDISNLPWCAKNFLRCLDLY